MVTSVVDERCQSAPQALERLRLHTAEPTDKRLSGLPANLSLGCRCPCAPAGCGTRGYGFLACFDGPARAIRCAQAIAAGAPGIGLDIRAGLHTGECEVRRDDLAGIAVHVGARVAALADPGEVLVTSMVRDLVAGSGIEFTDRGRHTLKGVPGDWQVLAAKS